MNRLCIHSNERHHTIATVNVECLSHGTKAMGCIDITSVIFVVTHTPSELVILVFLPIVRPEVIQIMDICTLRTENLAEDALLSHVQGVHLKPVIAAVFKNHAVLARFFAQVDKIPALLQIHS